jgi:hypothetical protein
MRNRQGELRERWRRRLLSIPSATDRNHCWVNLIGQLQPPLGSSAIEYDRHAFTGSGSHGNIAMLVVERSTPWSSNRK